jgi:hypothetical protein
MTMAVDLDATAERLFEGVMAPLVLSGAVRPGHAIGARVALTFGEGRVPADRQLMTRVDAARVRRARRLAPIDALPGPSAADWALAAAFHDVLQAAHPMFDAPLRRSAAARILELAVVTIERIPGPANVGDALSRHAWLARVPDVTRTDTQVAWWAGSREFRGMEPPGRLQAWPKLRNVRVTRTARRLLDLGPLAVDRARLTDAVSALLSRTPLTDLATCTRAAPRFAWRPSTLAIVATRAGRKLALRALGRLVRTDADAALDRATRKLMTEGDGALVSPAVSLLAARALAEADERASSIQAQHPPASVTFSRALGALAASQALAEGEGTWSDPERARLIASLASDARSPAADEARSLLLRGSR